MAFDPDQYLAKKEGFNPDAYLAKKAPDLASNSGIDPEALSVGIQKGATFGARPAIAGVAGALGNAVGQIQQGNFKQAITDVPQVFGEARQGAIKEQQALQERSPGSSILGEIGGSFLMPGAVVKGAMGGAKGLVGAARLGATMGAGKAIGEADSLKGAVEDIGTGAAIGAGGDLLSKGASAAKNVIGRKLEESAAKNAIKATGAMLRDQRQIAGKGQTKALGKYLVDKGLVQAGDTYESVAQKALTLKKNAGEALDSIYSFAKNNFAGEIPGFNPVKDKKEILDAAKDALGDHVDGSAALSKLTNYLDDLGNKYGDASLDPRKANDIKSAIDEAINYSRNPLTKQPAVEDAFKAARRIVADKVEDSIASIGVKTNNPKVLDDLKEANLAYGNSKRVGTIAKDRVNREQANNSLGLRQSLLLGGGVAAGGIPGAIAGAASAIGLKTTERYGSAVLAQAEYALAKRLQGSGILRKMVESNPQAYQTLLQQTISSIGGQ